MKLYIFYSPTCPYCGPALKLIDEIHNNRNDFELIKIGPGYPGGAELAKQFDVASTPTFIIQGPGYPDNIGLRGSQTKEVLNKYLDVAAGKRQL